MPQSKFALRKKFRAIRRQIPADYRHTAAEKAATIFAEQAIFKNSSHIACYLPVQDEFATAPCIEMIWQAKKHCYLPILVENKCLRFVRYVYGDALHANQYAILEPAHINQVILAEELDLVITPLIAFDLFGNRLGTGGGYYDRTFAFLSEKSASKPYMLGLAYAAQQAELLPSDPWDIALQGIVTEFGLTSR